jgi:antitoxin VapB
MMKTAKLFQNGKSQAVRLPKEFRFESDRVYIKRVGNTVVLLPYENFWDTLLNSLSLFSADFMNERNQPPAQNREDGFS